MEPFSSKMALRYFFAGIMLVAAVLVNETIHQKQLNTMENDKKELLDKIDILSENIEHFQSKTEKLDADLDLKNKQVDYLQYLIEDKAQQIESLSKEKEQLEQELEQKKKELETRKLSMEATFYTAFCPTGCIGITKTGYSVKDTIYYKGMRIIAVDPNVIPLYSIVEIEFQDKTKMRAIALDTGGAIKNNRIDILVKTRKEAYKLGRQQVKVTVLREGKGNTESL